MLIFSSILDITHLFYNETMEVIGSLIFENLDILLTSAFMFYPFFAVIWESCK